MRRRLLALAAVLVIGGCGEMADRSAGSTGRDLLPGDPLDVPGLGVYTSDHALIYQEVDLATARVHLAALAVAPEHAGGYDRDLFGGWAPDPAGPGCTTRHRVLDRDAGLTVTEGGLCEHIRIVEVTDPYTGQPTRDVEIDHIVALAEAWDSGAHAWDNARREAFGNDLANLVASDASVNRSKSGGDVADWVAHDAAGRCFFAVHTITVKHTWGLTIDPAERAELGETLDWECA